MPTQLVRVLQGPNIHELVDSFKYQSYPNERRMPVTFRIQDPQGTNTGFAEPVLETISIRSMEYSLVQDDTLSLSMYLRLFRVRNSPIWDVSGSYTFSPASLRGGEFFLERTTDRTP